jgi:hypothetical protein
MSDIKDLWELGIAKGTRDERERIIELLEAKEHQAMRAGQGKPMPERMEYLAVETSIRQVIALIKGETK